jgi:hypothetical protein
MSYPICECTDMHCPCHDGTQFCTHVDTTRLYRIDMEDKHGIRMCDDCASDAFESGLFTDEKGE